MGRPARDEFERWVREHHAAVYASARRILPQGADAEDVTHEVYLRVLEGKDRIDAAGDARTLLRWLATRLALNRLRAVRRRERHEKRRPVPAAQEDPMITVADADEQRSVEAALRALPDELRLPLVLRFQEGRTVEEVSECLSIAKSTAHERVQRGLDRLRHTLARAGLAVLPARLPEILAAAAPPPVPATLARTLLALTPVAGSLSALALKVGAASVLALGAFTAWSMRGAEDERGASETMPSALVAADHGGETMPARDAASRAHERAPIRRSSVEDPPLPDSAAERDNEQGEATAIVRGTVRDASGRPVADARVFAAEAGKSRGRESWQARTDAEGRFALTVSLPRPDMELVLYVTLFGRTVMLSGDPGLHGTVPFRVRAGDVNAQHDLVLSAEEGDATTRWTLDVAVVAPDGTPARRVPITMYPGGSPNLRTRLWTVAEGSTEDAGVARLHGMRTGSAVLVVDGRAVGAQCVIEPIELRAGMSERRVRLPAGLLLTGRVVACEGEDAASLGGTAIVSLVDDESQLHHQAQVASDGTFAFRDLDAGSFTLRASAHDRSAVCIRDVRAGPEPLLLRLKAEDDPRDVGDHMAEVHGTLRDAGTGEMLGVSLWDVRQHETIEGESTLACDLASPRGLQAQRAAFDRGDRDAFHVTGLEPGRHVIAVTKHGYAPGFVPVTLAEREIVRDLCIDLHRGATAEGLILDGTGAPLSGATVFVVGVGATADAHIAAWDAAEREPFDRRPAPSLLAARTRSQNDGAFELRRLPPGVLLRVVAIHPRYEPAASAPLVLADGAATRVELRLAARRE
jgi:RNA polymerase sigma-70 factor (ECF subfamily)